MEIAGFIILIVSLIIYLLPSLIACERNHLNQIPILIINLFLGWTLIGWVLCLAWSLTNDSKKR